MPQQDFLYSTPADAVPAPAMSSHPSQAAARTCTGALIVNADDWGRDRTATDRTLECAIRGAVSSVSAMVFMADSDRAATLAWEAHIDAGLHLNLTTPFTSRQCPAPLADHQRKVARFLRRHRLAQALFHPLLTRSFAYVVAAQMDEFRRLYGENPRRVDGHHHMHLCANVLYGGLLPQGAIARRTFSFRPEEKGWAGWFYRRSLDRRLSRRHRMVDYFFSLPPLEPAGRLQRIFSLARHAVVEVETHPANSQEYRFLTSGELNARAAGLQIATHFCMPHPCTPHHGTVLEQRRLTPGDSK